jgi:hypothetical protein
VPYLILPAGTAIDGEGRHAAPWPIVRSTGTEALRLLEEIRRNQPDVTPVIIGDREEALRLIDNYAFYTETPEHILATSAGLDCERWLEQREEELRENRGAGPASPPAQSFWRRLVDSGAPSTPSLFPRGPWPRGAAPNREIASLTHVLRHTPLPELFVALLPTREAWQAGAHTKFGGWNECPEAEVQVAFAKRWSDRHGASVVANTDDVLEFRVERPIGRREAAMAMAREQYLFCEDIVEQGVGTIDALAATLLGATVWYFWWD